MTERADPVNDAAGNVRPGLGAGTRSTRRTLPRAAAFWILAVPFLMVFFASAAASPLYRVYQGRFGFSAATLTAIFAVYVLVLLVTLLFCGSLSVHLGRLPVIVAALVFSMAACAVFLVAHGDEDVGDDLSMLEREQFSSPSEARLYLVQNEQDAVMVAEVALRRQQRPHGEAAGGDPGGQIPRHLRP